MALELESVADPAKPWLAPEFKVTSPEGVVMEADTVLAPPLVPLPASQSVALRKSALLLLEW